MPEVDKTAARAKVVSIAGGSPVRMADKIPQVREVTILALLLSGERYGREIRNEYEGRTGEALPLGSLYVTLDRMEEKGYLRSRLGESTHPHGGNRRKYYRIAAEGHRALEAWDAWHLGLAGVRHA
jgi:PadR family transcriptional regulator PadR